MESHTPIMCRALEPKYMTWVWPRKKIYDIDVDNVDKMLILHFADLGQFFLHLLIGIGFTFQAFYLSFTQDGTAAAWIRLPRCQGAER